MPLSAMPRAASMPDGQQEAEHGVDAALRRVRPVGRADLDVDAGVRQRAEDPCGVGDQLRRGRRAARRAERERAVRLEHERDVRRADRGGGAVGPVAVRRLLGPRGQPAAGVALPRHHPEDRHLHEGLGVAGLGVRDVVGDLAPDLAVGDPGAEPLRLGRQRDPRQQVLAGPGGPGPRQPRLVGRPLVDAPRAAGQRVQLVGAGGVGFREWWPRSRRAASARRAARARPGSGARAGAGVGCIGGVPCRGGAAALLGVSSRYESPAAGRQGNARERDPGGQGSMRPARTAYLVSSCGLACCVYGAGRLGEELGRHPLGHGAPPAGPQLRGVHHQAFEAASLDLAPLQQQPGAWPAAVDRHGDPAVPGGGVVAAVAGS